MHRPLPLHALPLARAVNPWRINSAHSQIMGLDASSAVSLAVTGVDVGLMLLVVGAALGVGYLYTKHPA